MAAPQQLLSVGAQCSHQSCMLVDFLPFKCQHCESSFCQEHFMVTAHKCPKYDETKHNRVAPNCPLCNVPVSVRPGQDANMAMEAHFSKDCSVMTGKLKTKNTPVCAKARCGKTLFSPIRCTKCNEQFCPSHRFPADHSCVSTGAAAPPRTAGLSASSRLLDLNTKASAAGAATMGAIKTMASTSTSRPPAAKAPPASKSASHAPNMPNLFSKTDRSSYSSPLPTDHINATADPNAPDETKSTPEPAIRPLSFVPPPIFARAKAERESRRKAMQERAKKGLLSEEEKLVLASEEAARAQHGVEDKKDCLIM
ncbi:hypothetical protein C8R43DRAFT_1114232 [Mycena crocata]|nr:hypothetical protein C8R43DRAFT_1114232 [Mycena crocata]